MYCINCGKELDNDAVFCDECGFPVELDEEMVSDSLQRDEAGTEVLDDAEAFDFRVEDSADAAYDDTVFAAGDESEEEIFSTQVLGDTLQGKGSEKTELSSGEDVLSDNPKEETTVDDHAVAVKAPEKRSVSRVAFAAFFLILGILIGSTMERALTFVRSGAGRVEMPLTITVQPKTVAVKNGKTAVFSVEAQGDGLAYQWQLSDDQGENWRNSKTTGSEYSATVDESNNGRCVRCIVKDEHGNQAVSEAAYMRITTLKITKQPVSVKGKKGDTVTFKVEADGPGIVYQWQLSDDKGETWRDSSTKEAQYTTALSDKNNGRYIRCVVTDKYGNSVASEPATMTIK